MGDHGVYFKSTMYEGSVGVPLILSAPDIPAGGRAKTIVSLVDVFPTILECAGAKKNPADAELPGKSLWAYAAGKEDPQRMAFSEYYSQGSYTAQFMLRRGKYKYVHYVGEVPQLFDLEADPDELHDLAGDSRYASVCADMEKTLRGIADVDRLEAESKAAQKILLDKHGGRDGFLKNFKPALFSPIPDLSE
jgi:choline-sulfatase